MNAHAFAQGADIHLANGQEKHLPHEAWPVAQQKQGRVRPTKQLKSVNINDDVSLEKEADIMGEKAVNISDSPLIRDAVSQVPLQSNTVQRVIRYGKPFKFINIIPDLPEELSKYADLLKPLIEDRKMYAFPTAEELQLLVQHPAVVNILRRNSFSLSNENDPIFNRVSLWITKLRVRHVNSNLSCCDL